MKLTHKLCGAALLAVLGVSVVLPGVTQAAPNSMNGDADIEFTRNTSENTSVSKPSNSESMITDITATDPGPFGIVAITPLDFKSHTALTGNQPRVYWAAPHVANKGNADEFLVENFVKFKDERSVSNHKYSLSAALTKNFTGKDDQNANVTLEGAELTFNNLILTTIVDPALRPTTPTLNQGTKLKFGETAKPFYLNTEATKGKGSYELTFGSQDAGNAKDSISLTVPASTDIFESKYNATITWTLAETL